MRVRNRMTGDKAYSGTCPGNAETMLWQCLKHRSVSPAGQRPCSDNIKEWIGPRTLMEGNGIERHFASTSFGAFFPTPPNERFVLMTDHVCVKDNALGHHLDKTPKALSQASPTPSQSSLNLCKSIHGECADHQHRPAPVMFEKSTQLLPQLAPSAGRKHLWRVPLHMS